nr:hypothetical protein [Nocardioides ungokensis]
MATGPGRIDDKRQPRPAGRGRRRQVIYSKYGGTEVKYGGSEFLILSARDVLAVVS